MKRRRRSRRFAAVGRGLAAGLPALSPNARRPGAPRVRGTRPFPADLRRFTEGPGIKSKQQSNKSFCGRDCRALLFPGSPPGRGEQVEEKPEGSRAGCARVRRLYMDVLPTNPGACSRSQRAGMPADRVLEGALSLVTFFGQAKKVTRPPGWRTKPHTDVGRFSRGTPRQKTKSKWIPAFAGMTAKSAASPRHVSRRDMLSRRLHIMR